MVSDEEKAAQHAELDHREERMLALFGRLRRQIDQGVVAGSPGRKWLRQFAFGKGANLCCGDFPIGDSIGIDADWEKLATDLWGYADRPPFEDGTIDYVLTNYLEAFPDTLQVLQNWTKALRVGGILAIVCRNTDAYDNPMGPLTNKHRAHCFSLKTLSCYLQRAGFRVKLHEFHEQELWVAAVKL